MDETIEKSCWGITLWAVAIVVGITLLASFVMNAETNMASRDQAQNISVATIVTP